MARRKRKRRFGSATEAHREGARGSIREMKRLSRSLRSYLQAPADCSSAARLALRLAEVSGSHAAERYHAGGLSRGRWFTTSLGGRGVRGLLNRFVSACVMKPRSAAAERKIHAVWRRSS